MRKFLTGLLRMLLVLLVALVVVWSFFCHVKVTDAAAAQQIYQSTIARYREAERQAASDNGFAVLDSVLWRTARDEDRWPYTALTSFSGYDFKKDPVGQTALAEFEKVLPRLREAASHAYFRPRMDLDQGVSILQPYGSSVPDWELMQSIGRNLVLHGDYLEREGKPVHALQDYMVAFGLGSKLGKDASPIQLRTSVVIQWSGLRSIISLLGERNLDAAAYKRTAADLAALSLRPEDFAFAMDLEYAVLVHTINQMQAGRLQPSLYPANAKPNAAEYLLWIPGFLEREKRLCQNFYLKYRPYWKELKDPSQDGLYIGTDMRQLRSLMVPLYLHNGLELAAQTRLVMTLTGGSAILAALQAYRLEKGHYPASLQELVPDYVAQLPRSYTSKDGAFVYKREGASFVLHSGTELVSSLLRSMEGGITFYSSSR